MASLRHENDRGRTGWRLQFRDAEKRKRSIYLGDIPEHSACEVKVHVEHLLATVPDGQPPELPTVKWLGAIGDELRNKLARCGLTEPVATRVARVLTLAAWLDEYMADRKEVKQETRNTYAKAQDNLLLYFGRKKLLRDVTPTDAKKWRVWLKTEGNRRDSNRTTMADETVRRRTGMVKQFFNEAVARGYIESNPFAGLTSTNQGNAKRQFFVKAESIEACMEHCPCIDWKTILALARFGGLRCPSELVALRWSDVDLPGGKMTINASKTEHHASGGVRVCPIFPELRPYLETAWDAAPDGPGSEFVVNRYRRPNQNLRETFLKILARAGVTPWPRLFQNLRASRETELMARYPTKDVAAWLGNSVPVAMRHYAMATDESFQAAADPAGQTVTRSPKPAPSENGGSTGGSIPTVYGDIEQEPENEKTPLSAEETGVSIVRDSSGNYYLMGDIGFEPTTSTMST